MAKHRRRHEQSAQKAPVSNNSRMLLISGIAGIVVMLLVFSAVLMFSAKEEPATQKKGTPATPTMDGDTQVIRMSVENLQYTPSEFTVQAGKPVRWVIDGTGARGCDQYFVAQEFGISRRLAKGENVLEFTPTRTGDFAFSCSMNMVSGVMHVV
jgi:plastocyanin domain-containing protein